MSKEVYRIIYRQLVYISQNGCKNIKCRKCILNKTCDHFPDHSVFFAQLALNVIRNSKGKKYEKN